MKRIYFLETNKVYNTHFFQMLEFEFKPYFFQPQHERNFTPTTPTVLRYSNPTFYSINQYFYFTIDTSIQRVLSGPTLHRMQISEPGT